MAGINLKVMRNVDIPSPTARDDSYLRVPIFSAWSSYKTIARVIIETSATLITQTITYSPTNALTYDPDY